MKPILVANIGYCPNCKETIQSLHRNHFVSCSCGRSSLDGGLDYVRMIGGTDSKAVYSDDTFNRIRENMKLNLDGNWLSLKDVPNEALNKIVEALDDLLDPEIIQKVDIYHKELKLRKVESDFVTD